MNYLMAAIHESMRLFPSVQFDSKSCLDDDTLPDGTFVRKATRPKEASQRGSNGVPSRQKEADDDISEQFIVVDDSHESREKIGLVGAVAAFPLSFDHLLRQFIDQTDSLAELLLGPDIQQSLDLPHRWRDRHGALRREFRHRQGQAQAPRIHPEREFADIIKRESPQNILDVPISSDNVAENMNVNGAGGRFVEQTRIPISQIAMLHSPA
nr:cytochrome P450 94C1-like [Ipomoea batatas]